MLIWPLTCFAKFKQRTTDRSSTLISLYTTLHSFEVIETFINLIYVLICIHMYLKSKIKNHLVLVLGTLRTLPCCSYKMWRLKYRTFSSTSTTISVTIHVLISYKNQINLRRFKCASNQILICLFN